MYLTYQAHHEAIVIPENIDCIRRWCGLFGRPRSEAVLRCSTARDTQHNKAVALKEYLEK